MRTPVDLKLKPNWRFDESRRVFVSAKGEEFAPRGELPKNSRIVYKVPALAASRKALTKDEKDLQRYMQVILPKDASPADYVDAVRAWPCVAEAHVAPQLSLPKG
jgi:hypothetical protein